MGCICETKCEVEYVGVTLPLVSFFMYITFFEIQFITTYQVPLSIARKKAFLWSYSGEERGEYLAKTHLADLVTTNHLMPTPGIEPRVAVVRDQTVNH